MNKKKETFPVVVERLLSSWRESVLLHRHRQHDGIDVDLGSHHLVLK